MQYVKLRATTGRETPEPPAQTFQLSRFVQLLTTYLRDIFYHKTRVN
jgi:hypothetical protein